MSEKRKRKLREQTIRNPDSRCDICKKIHTRNSKWCSMPCYKKSKEFRSRNYVIRKDLASYKRNCKYSTTANRIKKQARAEVVAEIRAGIDKIYHYELPTLDEDTSIDDILEAYEERFEQILDSVEKGGE